MAQLPEITLRCRNEHSFTSHARGGTTLACPVCRKDGNRISVWVPRNRPKTEREARERTAAQARTVAAGADDDDGLTAAWADEPPYDPGRSGSHPGGISAKARALGAQHLAAIDKSAARKSAQLADPEAERRAGETLVAECAMLIDNLDVAADRLDTRDLPREEPYLPARRAGTGMRAVVLDYIEQARHADTLDKLNRINRDVWDYLQRHVAWITRIEDLRKQLDRGADMIRAEVIHDDQADEYGDGGQQAEDDEYDPQADRAERQIREALTRAAITRRADAAAQRPGGLRMGGIAPVPGRYCEQCKREHRYVNGTYPLAIGCAGLPDGPEYLCADHFAEAQLRHGRAMSVIAWGESA